MFSCLNHVSANKSGSVFFVLVVRKTEEEEWPDGIHVVEPVEICMSGELMWLCITNALRQLLCDAFTDLSMLMNIYIFAQIASLRTLGCLWSTAWILIGEICSVIKNKQSCTNSHRRCVLRRYSAVRCFTFLNKGLVHRVAQLVLFWQMQIKQPTPGTAAQSPGTCWWTPPPGPSLNLSWVR